MGSMLPYIAYMDPMGYSTYYKYTQRPWTFGFVKSCCWLRRNVASESDAEGRMDLGDSIGTCGWDSMIFNSLYVAMNQCSQCSPCHNHWNFLPSQNLNMEHLPEHVCVCGKNWGWLLVVFSPVFVDSIFQESPCCLLIWQFSGKMIIISPHNMFFPLKCSDNSNHFQPSSGTSNVI